MLKRLKAREIKYTEKGFLEKLGLNDLNALSLKGVKINGRFLVPLEDISDVTIVYTVLVDQNDFEIKN